MNTENVLEKYRHLEIELGEAMGAEAISLDGPCPFLTCLEDGPHKHYICPDCGAVKFGNGLCRGACAKFVELARAKDA